MGWYVDDRVLSYFLKSDSESLICDLERILMGAFDKSGFVIFDDRRHLFITIFMITDAFKDQVKLFNFRHTP